MSKCTGWRRCGAGELCRLCRCLSSQRYIAEIWVDPEACAAEVRQALLFWRLYPCPYPHRCQMSLDSAAGRIDVGGVEGGVEEGEEGEEGAEGMMEGAAGAAGARADEKGGEAEAKSGAEGAEASPETEESPATVMADASPFTILEDGSRGDTLLAGVGSLVSPAESATTTETLHSPDGSATEPMTSPATTTPHHISGSAARHNNKSASGEGLGTGGEFAESRAESAEMSDSDAEENNNAKFPLSPLPPRRTHQTYAHNNNFPLSPRPRGNPSAYALSAVGCASGLLGRRVYLMPGDYHPKGPDPFRSS